MLLIKIKPPVPPKLRLYFSANAKFQYFSTSVLYLHTMLYTILVQKGGLKEKIHEPKIIFMRDALMKDFTLYIVDDEEAIIDSMVWLLEGWGYQVKPFDNPQLFIRELQSQSKFDVCAAIVDVRIPHMSGLEIQHWLMDNYPFMPIAIMTAHGDIDMAVDTLKKGAIDFLQKPFDETQLKALLAQLEQKARTLYQRHNQELLLKKLSNREQEVLNHILTGLLNKQIAQAMNLSIKTIEAHRANIMTKLQASSVADLVRIALRVNAGTKMHAHNDLPAALQIIKPDTE